MKWRKCGQLYKAGYVHPKLSSHAANPLPVCLEGDIYRVFFSGRDGDNRSSVGFVDVDIVRQKVLYVHDSPVFIHGSEGSFYSHGVSIGNCYETSGKHYMLFMGWQCRPGKHWRGEIGRLILENKSSLYLEADLPFMELNDRDPISLSYPWVSHELGGAFKMWYGSTISWDAGNGEMLHVINRAVSKDGHHWHREGLSVPHRIGVAQAFSRPSVIGNAEDGYHMWFSYRDGLGKTYRIGYAWSETGDTWVLKLAEAGIDVSTSGWDSAMIEYPFVFDHKGERYMLYNGNGYGESGFGLAVMESN
jgi:hypothetical protein